MGYKIADFKIGSPKKAVRAKKAKGRKNKGDADSNKAKETTQSKKGDIQHTLNLRFDFSLRNQSAINRNILTETSEATSGNKAVQISFSADYQLSKALTLTAYYDRQMNKPLLTSSSYPTTTQDFGISFKFSLNH